MRILYHHRTLGDGAEGVHIRAMVDAFRAIGCDVVIGSLGGDGSTPNRAAAAFRRLAPPMLLEGGLIAANAADYLQARRTLREMRIELLYKRHGRYDVGALLAAARAGVPSVLEVNSLFTEPPYYGFEPLRFRRTARALERRALRSAAIVAAVSSPLARQIEQLADREVLVVPNGADPDRFNPSAVDAASVRTRLGLTGELVVGWSGILRDWHGLELLIEAMRDVGSARLLVLGDGPARAAMEACAAAFGVRDRLVAPGRVPHHEMPAYIAAMDVAVVADERTGVASPMKMLEYMAMARAVVAPDLANIRDVIENDVNGLLFEPGTVSSLTEMIVRALSDVELRRALGGRARLDVERERNWTRNAERLTAAVRRSG